MIKLLRADFIRLRRSLAFKLSIVGMLALAALFMLIQATDMEYTVPLSRVVFLPMSMYGVAMSAFISVFVGTDFSDGFIRNKLLTVSQRRSIVISQIVVSCTACAAVYILITAFSAGIGQFFFENDVKGTTLFSYFIIGLGMCAATGCLFSIITMLCGNKTHAVIWCMGLAFGMLFLCLHTNEVLVQKEYKDGILNPHYVGGFRRTLNSILHDINPCGQAAQLSSWEVWHPLRIVLLDLLLVIGVTALGCGLFNKKDIN